MVLSTEVLIFNALFDDLLQRVECRASCCVVGGYEMMVNEAL
jgi:hypothetical protein